jgi:hypothetical protein
VSILGLHHVGHVVPDLPEALHACRRLGFAVTPPTFPALPGPGGTLQPVGAGNARIPLGDAFVEVVAVLGDAPPPGGAVLVPLEVPDGGLDRLAAGIAVTTRRLQEALARSAGLHILVLATADADAAAARLSAAGVAHHGVQRAHRPGPDGPVPLAVLEIDATPEGRLALAEPLPAGAGVDHPNGAIRLADVLLCVADPDLDAVAARYAAYTGRRPGVEGPTRVLDLPAGRVTVVPRTALDSLMPGEEPPALPALVGCTVGVRDLARAEDLLVRAGVPLRRTPAGLPFVPAAAALGAAVVFERAVRPR